MSNSRNPNNAQVAGCGCKVKAPVLGEDLLDRDLSAQVGAINYAAIKPMTMDQSVMRRTPPPTGAPMKTTCGQKVSIALGACVRYMQSRSLFTTDERRAALAQKLSSLSGATNIGAELLKDEASIWAQLNSGAVTNVTRAQDAAALQALQAVNAVIACYGGMQFKLPFRPASIVDSGRNFIGSYR